MLTEIEDTNIDKEAQLLLIKGEKKLRCKTIQSELDTYDDIEIDSFLEKKSLDNKQIIKITTFIYEVSGSYNKKYIANQIWYYE